MNAGKRTRATNTHLDFETEYDPAGPSQSHSNHQADYTQVDVRAVSTHESVHIYGKVSPGRKFTRENSSQDPLLVRAVPTGVSIDPVSSSLEEQPKFKGLYHL